MALSCWSISTELPEIVIFESKVHEDDRGTFSELFRTEQLQEFLGVPPFVQENLSFSESDVVRGLHYQLPPHDIGKLVTCIQGCIFDVAVDIRADSFTRGKWTCQNLNSPYKALWIPPGFAHGFLALQPSWVLYRQTDYHNEEAERSVAWNDPDIKITWPIAEDNANLSSKDMLADAFSEAIDEQLDDAKLREWKKFESKDQIAHSYWF